MVGITDVSIEQELIPERGEDDDDDQTVDHDLPHGIARVVSANEPEDADVETDIEKENGDRGDGERARPVESLRIEDGPDQRPDEPARASCSKPEPWCAVDDCGPPDAETADSGNRRRDEH